MSASKRAALRRIRLTLVDCGLRVSDVVERA